MTAQPQETCNALTKDGRHQHICELALGHDDENHRDGEYTWKDGAW